MAKKQHNEFAAGLFVLLALGAGVGVLIWLGAADVFTRRGQTVVFVASQERGSLGLEVGSAVKINDAAIGKIEKITPDPAGKRTFYQARLDRKDVLVHKDARAKAVAEFLGGASIILEDFGSQAAPLADRENPAPVGEGANAMFRQAQEALGYGDEQRRQFQATISNVAAAAENVRKIAVAIAGEVSEDNKNALLVRIKQTVEDLKGSSANLLAMTDNLKAETDRNNATSLLKKVHTIADDAGHTVSKIRQYTDKDIGDLLAGLRKSNTKLLGIVTDFKAISSTARDVVVLNRENLDETIANMKSVSLNLNAAAKEIRRHPWRLLDKPSEKDRRDQNVYDAARVFAEGAERLNSALARLEALRQARPDGVKADDPELLKIRKHLQGTIEKFRTVEDAFWKELAK